MTDESASRYKLLEQIGTGGLGDVYRARDTERGRTVAVKFPNPALTADPERREALLRQAREVARLSHPSVAALFDVGEADSRVYLVFEYISGRALRAVIGGHPIKPRRAVDFGIQIADALAEAHSAELVHGDLRPETIFVTGKDRAKILDFGLSDFTGGGRARRPTGAEGEGGDAAQRRAVASYLAPEEAAGEPADAVTDIFGLGCVLFEMLTGRQAFAKAASGDVQRAPRVSSIMRTVPGELDAIVARALAPDRTARYQTATTLAAELRGVGAILDVRTATNEGEFLDEEQPSAFRRALPWLLILAVAGGVAAGVWAC